MITNAAGTARLVEEMGMAGYFEESVGVAKSITVSVTPNLPCLAGLLGWYGGTYPKTRVTTPAFRTASGHPSCESHIFASSGIS
jgi:hypothetical protein